jgi:hypothetical protein
VDPAAQQVVGERPVPDRCAGLLGEAADSIRRGVVEPVHSLPRGGDPRQRAIQRVVTPRGGAERRPLEDEVPIRIIEVEALTGIGILQPGLATQQVVLDVGLVLAGVDHLGELTQRVVDVASDGGACEPDLFDLDHLTEGIEASAGDDVVRIGLGDQAPIVGQRVHPPNARESRLHRAIEDIVLVSRELERIGAAREARRRLALEAPGSIVARGGLHLLVLRSCARGRDFTAETVQVDRADTDAPGSVRAIAPRDGGGARRVDVEVGGFGEIRRRAVPHQPPEGVVAAKRAGTRCKTVGIARAVHQASAGGVRLRALGRRRVGELRAVAELVYECRGEAVI